MDGTLAIILLVVCLALLAVEVFIPSGGLILVTALASLAGSIWLGWRAWSETPPVFWLFIATIIVLVPTAIGVTLYWFPRTEMGKRMLLDGPSLDEVTGYTEETNRLSALIGKQGKSLTLMNPGGLVLVDGERHHSESVGLLIEPGEPIEVVGISGTRIVVRRATETSEAPKDAEPPQTEEAVASIDRPDKPISEDRPVDFEMPTG